MNIGQIATGIIRLSPKNPKKNGKLIEIVIKTGDVGINIKYQLIVVICKEGEVNICCQHKLKGKSILRPGQVDKFQNENLGACENFQVIRDTDQYDYYIVSVRLSLVTLILHRYIIGTLLASKS